MPELGKYGSVRGARGNSRPYRDHRDWRASCPLLTDIVAKRFFASRRATLIQKMNPSRKIDSRLIERSRYRGVTARSHEEPPA
jgi:hypothetical protein